MLIQMHCYCSNTILFGKCFYLQFKRVIEPIHTVLFVPLTDSLKRFRLKGSATFDLGSYFCVAWLAVVWTIMHLALRHGAILHLLWGVSTEQRLLLYRIHTNLILSAAMKSEHTRQSAKTDQSTEGILRTPGTLFLEQGAV